MPDQMWPCVCAQRSRRHALCCAHSAVAGPGRRLVLLGGSGAFTRPLMWRTSSTTGEGKHSMLEYDAQTQCYVGPRFIVTADAFAAVVTARTAAGFAPAAARQRVLDEREWAADMHGVALRCASCGTAVPQLGDRFCSQRCERQTAPPAAGAPSILVKEAG